MTSMTSMTDMVDMTEEEMKEELEIEKAYQDLWSAFANEDISLIK